MKNAGRGAVIAGLIAAAASLGSCGTAPEADSGSAAGAGHAVSIPLPAPDAPAPRDLPGIHNVVAYRAGFLSGGAPEGDAGFDSLAAMGIRTIISVDGAVPDAARADARGMRTIHLPIGYDGFDEERRLQLARAARDAMEAGPVYIHCHHGKHRSAGAAAAIAASLGWMTAEEGVERMHVSGTAPSYRGLYACARDAEPVSLARLEDVPADFPSAWAPSSFVQGMVEIDEVMARLRTIERAGWRTPPRHPDLVPPAEAGRLADLHRLLVATDETSRWPADFTVLLKLGCDRATRLEELLLAGDAAPERLSRELEAIAASCKTCHVRYRD